jgi:hypothetical protein
MPAALPEPTQAPHAIRDAPQFESGHPPSLWLAPQTRERLPFLAVAAVMIVAGGLVATVNGAAPFAHGSWLAAYLVLVGGVAQLALGTGCLLLPQARCSTGLRWAQLGLWNLGTLSVAGGVLTDLFGVVLGGSILVAAALACFAAGSGPLRHPGRRRVIVYRLLIGLLAISVLVGGVLAHGSTAG